MKKLPALCGWISFLLPFVIYLLTLCPTVHWGDSGELITAAYTLGIPHPPGHPLYAIIGKLFTLIPIGSIAWRVNLMSAFFGAVTSFLIYKIILDRLEDSPWRYAAAVGGAMFFAFAPTVWDQTTAAETTTLHSTFMMLLTWLGFRLASGKIIWRNETYSLCLFSFLYGFSMTNHVAGVFFLPAFIYLFLSSYGKRILVPQLLVKMIASCFVASLVYLYLPIRSLANPPLDWGNPETWSNFWWVVTARQYAPNLTRRPAFLWGLLHLYVQAKGMMDEFTVIGCVFGVIGAYSLWRRERRFILFSLLLIVVLAYIGLNSAFISAYFVPALAVMAVWIGTGLYRVIGFVSAVSVQVRFHSLVPAFKKVAFSTLPLTFVLPLALNFAPMNRSKDLYARRYGEQILQKLPKDSLLFTSDGYALFILWYLTFCERVRTDVMIIEPNWLISNDVLFSQIQEQYPALLLPQAEAITESTSGTNRKAQRFLAMQKIVEANYDKRDVYWGIITEDLPFFDHLIPLGVINKYSRERVTLNYEILAENEKFWDEEMAHYRLHPEMKKTCLVNDAYPVELNNQGLMFEALGRDDLARSATERALAFNPEYPVSHFNLGRLLFRAGKDEDAIKEYRKAIRLEPFMAVAYYNLGNCYKRTNKLGDAFLAFRKATRLRVDYHEAMTALGQLYALAGQHNDAIRQFQKALTIEPSYPFALRGLASSCLALGKLPEARAALLKALQVEPDSAAGLFILAKYNARMGDPNAAKQALSHSMKIGGPVFLTKAASDEDLKDLAQQMTAVND